MKAKPQSEPNTAVVRKTLNALVAVAKRNELLPIQLVANVVVFATPINRAAIQRISRLPGCPKIVVNGSVLVRPKEFVVWCNKNQRLVQAAARGKEERCTKP